MEVEETESNTIDLVFGSLKRSESGPGPPVLKIESSLLSGVRVMRHCILTHRLIDETPFPPY